MAGLRKKVSEIRRKVGGAARSIDLHCFPCDRSHRRARHAAMRAPPNRPASEPWEWRRQHDAPRSRSGRSATRRVVQGLVAWLSVSHDPLAFPSRIRAAPDRRDARQVFRRRSHRLVRPRPSRAARSEPAAQLGQRHGRRRNRRAPQSRDPVRSVVRAPLHGRVPRMPRRAGAARRCAARGRLRRGDERRDRPRCSMRC